MPLHQTMGRPMEILQLLGTNVTTTISTSEVITADDSMAVILVYGTDKAAQNISYSSSTGGGNAIIFIQTVI